MYKLIVGLNRNFRSNFNKYSTPQIFQKFSNSTTQNVINEESIQKKLRTTFPAASYIMVEDTSGGCGAMFSIFIESKDFKGLSVMKQHRLVYDSLKDELKSIHGLHLETKTSK